ncbi:nicotinic acetylcholine receptor subunit beta [Enterobacter asburiae]|uniref:nicotinic acetylcholine receptor subunit beta n=1 Tax=Enterobacter asburiae TaxID=61645 RepID=UPI0015E92960|nr:nicotinic acetylcholine receptor subunit beta [Enterobacter asburiae]QLY66298.1 nicotinic acetylcholine receptor subunit beta [Enterobacter asburiae]
MNINLLYRHPAENDVDAMLSREHAYPDSFSLAERTAERLDRARLGLSHVKTELLPALEEDQRAEMYCWLSKVLTIVDAGRLDAEGRV